MKIEKLTDLQIERLAVYREKWTKIGLSTDKTDRLKAERAVRAAYTIAGLAEPKMIFWAQSPIGLLITAKLIKQISKEGFNPYSEMDLDSVRDSVSDSVRDSVSASVWDSVRDSVWDSVRDSELRSEWNECNSWGQHDAAWLGFYEYFLKELAIEDCEKLRPLMTLAEETGWHLFYKDIVILSEKTCELHRNTRGQMHNSNGPAIKYLDGYELHTLNGIRMSKEKAELKPEDLTKEIILNETNADIRRELIRKLPASRLIKILDSKTIDENHGYKLLSIDMGDKRDRPYLYMKNPSLKDVIHVEGVHPDCKTVEDAIKFRNGLKTFNLPISLS